MSQPFDFWIGSTPAFTEEERQLSNLEQSWCDFAYSLRTHNRPQCNTSGKVVSIRGLGLPGVRQQFDAYRERFKNGDVAALLGALCYTLEEAVPPPYWLAQEVRRRIALVYQTPISLHSAFGLDSKFPIKGKKALNARRILQHRKNLYVKAETARHEKGLSLDKALKEVLATGEFPFGLTRARKLFNEQDRIQRLHLGKKDIRR